MELGPWLDLKSKGDRSYLCQSSIGRGGTPPADRAVVMRDGEKVGELNEERIERESLN